jgi:hypothetical protein
MKILDFDCLSVFTMLIDGNRYYRFSKDNWMMLNGESLEPIFSCAALEKVFEEYMEE